MQQIYPTNWPVAVDMSDPRDQFHERALHEARIATEYRQAAALAPEPASTSLVHRLRLAIAGGSTATVSEPCNCPA